MSSFIEYVSNFIGTENKRFYNLIHSNSNTCGFGKEISIGSQVRLLCVMFLRNITQQNDSSSLRGCFHPPKPRGAFFLFPTLTAASTLASSTSHLLNNVSPPVLTVFVILSECTSTLLFMYYARLLIQLE